MKQNIDKSPSSVTRNVNVLKFHQTKMCTLLQELLKWPSFSLIDNMVQMIPKLKAIYLRFEVIR